ncbi:Protein rhomboid, partial [Pseudolycoriella hygida]
HTMRSATEENYPYIETITMTRLDASGNPIMIYFFVDGAYMVRTFGYNPYRRDEFWRYLSVMFVHYNATHLWNSVRMQLAIGLPLEMVHGWKRVGLIYLMSVLGGTLFTPFVDFHTYSYGAKTAVLGLFFANVIDFTLNWRVMKQKHLRTFTVAIFMLHFSLLCLSGIHYPQIRRFRLVIYYAFDRPYMIKSFGYNPYRRHEVWRFLSMVLVHEDELHLWDNVVMQICLGVLLEKYHGWQRVGSIYLISVVGGSLFTSAVSFRIYMAGASSAVMGLFFTQAVDFFLNWKNLDKRFFRVFSVWAYIIHSVLLTTLIDRVTPENHHTDRFVHIGGGFTGLFSAGLLMKNVKLEEWQNKFQKLSAFVLASTMVKRRQAYQIVTPKPIRKISKKKTPTKVPWFILIVTIFQGLLFYMMDETDLIYKLGYDPYRRHEIWRYLTVMFVHRDVLHLWSVAWMQFFLGVPLENVHGGLRLAPIYIASVLGGSLLTSAIGYRSYYAGASSAVTGLFLTQAAEFVMNWKEMNRARLRMLCLFIYLCLTIMTTILSIVLDTSKLDDHANDVYAHIGGGVVGFLSASVLLKISKPAEWHIIYQRFCILGITIFIFVTSIISVTSKETPEALKKLVEEYMKLEDYENSTMPFYIQPNKLTMPRRTRGHQPSIPITITRRKKLPNHMPWFIISISIIQVVVFYALDRALLMKAFGYDPYRRHEFWRFLTVMFAHKDELHLWNNVLMQLLLGVLLEAAHGWMRIGSIYFVSVIGGSLLKSAVGYRTYAAGASSAAMGLLFAQGVDFAMNWKRMKKPWFRLMSVWIYIGHSIVLSLLSVLLDTNKLKDHHTDRFPHIGGGITGLLFSSLVLKKARLENWEKIFQRVSAVTLLGLIFTLIIVSGFSEDIPQPPTEPNEPNVEFYENSEPFYFEE